MPNDVFHLRDLDDVISEAIRDPDRTVELTLAPRSGYQIVIDGVPFPDDSWGGIPHETFAYPLDAIPLRGDQRELAAELLERRNGRVKRKQLERHREQTESHREAEGIEL
ncbi:hypothetical protein ACFQGT_00205 [Natrialbaceae archaeon GCM10025810]